MKEGLFVIDYLIILLSLVGSVWIGIHFSKGQKSTSKFFKAEGKIPAWAIGMSILATLISSVTFLAYPGEGFSNNWILLVQGLMVPVVLLFFIWFVVPLYRNAIGLSAYEYFERRFGLVARYYSSMGFIMAHFSKMGTILYLLSMAVANITGIDTIVIIWILGLIIIFVTLFGGIEAIIWLDVVQGFLLIFGGLISLFIIILNTDGGIGTIWQTGIENNRIGFGPFDWEFVNLTFWVMAINGIFYAIQKYGTDQTVIQRYLTAHTNKDAIKASLIGVLLSVPVWALFMFIGTSLYGYYAQTDFTTLPEGIKADAVFPYFIMHELPVGVSGLVISALIAAAVSSLDSDINSLSAVLTEDFYCKFRKKVNDQQKLLFGKIAILVSGALMVIVASLFTKIGGEGALGTIFKLYAIFSGGISGMLLLGLFSKRANKKGMNIGIITCVIFTSYAVLTSTKINNQLILDLGSLNFTHHHYMLGVYSHIILFVVGLSASYLYPKTELNEQLTYYGWTKLKRRKHVEINK